MGRKLFLLILVSLGLLLKVQIGVEAQESPNFHVVVNMVQLNVAVTDKKGNYITGLRPEDFAIAEDGIVEKVATFAEGDEPARSLGDSKEADSSVPADGFSKGAADAAIPRNFASLISGANVFVLFDTSDYMYRGFVFAQDAITEFIRSLGAADKVAFYSYSRDLSRAAVLTSDRSQILRAVRSTVAGDQAALYNALLLTLKDAAQHRGRKVVVVFSNGPDNSSVVPPEDVAEFAQSAGVSIYMISTQSAAPHKPNNKRRDSVVSSSRIATTERLTASFSFGYCPRNRAAISDNSLPAWAADTPGLSRPMPSR